MFNFLYFAIKVGKTFSYPNARRPDDGSKALGSLSFEVKITYTSYSATCITSRAFFVLILFLFRMHESISNL